MAIGGKETSNINKISLRLKKALIISPYFAPSNTPDMQRVRMSLPYFKENGWDVEVVCVYDKHSEFNKDDLLNKSFPTDIIIHNVRALPKELTSKFGLGSIALRSMYFYMRKVDQLLTDNKFDLIYFSTTQFPICILGSYWKKKFGIPFIIDMQDPWHTDYYQSKPKHERPKKYWFSYRLNKWLEPLAMKKVDGLISVSQLYLSELEDRYNNVKNIPKQVITFGYSDVDLEISRSMISPNSEKKSLVYIGVLGVMMQKSLEILFKGLKSFPNFQNDFQLVFKGTSYSADEKAEKTAVKTASKYNIQNITEETKRLGMFNVLSELNNSTGLLIIGTDDEGYTASKLYPYLQTKRPILAILHPNSSAIVVLSKISNAEIILLSDNENVIEDKLKKYFLMLEKGTYQVDVEKLKGYSSARLTEEQCVFFNEVVYKIN